MSLIHIHLSLENNVFVLLYSWQVEVEHLNGKMVYCHRFETAGLKATNKHRHVTKVQIVFAPQ